jgi:hypothetical protein
MGEGRKECEQWYLEVRVSREISEEILGVGEVVREGSPGWTKVERGALSGSGEDWVVVTGTAKYDKFEAGKVEECDREFQVLVCAAEGWRDHPRFESYIWDAASELHVGCTAHIHKIDAGVPMHLAPHCMAARNAFLTDVLARMDPPPAADTWGLQTDEMKRTVRLIRAAGSDGMRTMYVGAQVPCRFVWRGPPAGVAEAKKLLFLPSVAEFAQTVETVERRVEGDTTATTGVVTITSTAPTSIFWSTQGGAPVVLPALAVPREGASEARAAWEKGERTMLAIGGLAGAQQYSADAKSARVARDAKDRARVAGQQEVSNKQFKELSQGLEAALSK